jgi:hypothetical protein
MSARFLPTFLSAGLAALILSGPLPSAKAVTILTFGQSGSGNTITGTANGAQTATTISGTDVPITITQIDAAVVVPVSAFFTLSATSTGSATLVAGFVTQTYSGSFSITSMTGGGGVNYLSGTFTDAVFGANGGSGLTLTSAQPPNMASFTSSVITALDLPRSIDLSFANVTPAVSIAGTTLASFTSSVSGDYNATTVVPEPGAIAMTLSAVPVLGLFWARRRRARA